VAVSKAILDAAFRIHSHFGPGLLESVYETCLAHELRKMGLTVETHGVKMDVGYRLDLLIENLVIVEVKSVELLAPVHHAQTLSYLKLSSKRLGLLINFNTVHLKDGIKRFVIGDDWR
jgi:GxxExxY protein